MEQGTARHMLSALNDISDSLDQLSQHFTGSARDGEVWNYVPFTQEDGTQILVRRNSVIAWRSAVETRLIITDHNRAYYHRGRRYTQLLLAGHTEWMNVREREPQVGYIMDGFTNLDEGIANEDKEDADHNAAMQAETGKDGQP